MTSRAHVKYNYQIDGVDLLVARRSGDGSGPPHSVLVWNQGLGPSVRTIDPESAMVENDDEWLRLQEDDARAIYEALADYFGHTGHDIRSLRKDYDNERARVNKMIDALITGPRTRITNT